LAKQDKATRELQSRGVYSIGHAPHPYVIDNSTVEAVKEKRIYGFWPGVWYTTILSILLFWIPPFGQMIAGYVGGRKAGTPIKGMAAAFVPMSALFLMFILVQVGIMTDEFGWLFGLPLAGATYVGTSVPIIGPLVEFMVEYIQTFVTSIGFGGSFIAPYILTVIFGYVGGILSRQHQKEVAEDEHHTFTPIQYPVHQPQPFIQAPVPVAAGNENVVMGKIPDGWTGEKDKK